MEATLAEDDPEEDILILRKKLLRYARPLSDTDRTKYEKDLFFIQLKEEKAKGRNKTAGKMYL